MDNLSKNTRVQPCAGVDNLEGLSFFISTIPALIKGGRMDILGLKINRFNRSTFFLSTFLTMFLFVAVGLALSAIIGEIFGPFDPADPSSPHPAALIPFMVLWYVYLVICIVKRLHDLDIHGAWATGVVVGSLIPFAGFFIGIWLLFTKGTEGTNKYGEPAEGVHIMGLAL